MCACGSVEFTIAQLNIIGCCYCDDCVNRVRIGQELNGGNPEYVEEEEEAYAQLRSYARARV
jgi:hypothetical protein